MVRSAGQKVWCGSGPCRSCSQWEYSDGGDPFRCDPMAEVVRSEVICGFRNFQNVQKWSGRVIRGDRGGLRFRSEIGRAHV